MTLLCGDSFLFQTLRTNSELRTVFDHNFYDVTCVGSSVGLG